MTNRKRAMLMATLLAALLMAGTTFAATITASQTAPTVDGLDVANLVTATGGSSIWGDRPVVGQTFTTPAEPGNLLSLTVLVRDDNQSAPTNVIQGWKDWSWRFGTVTGLNSGTLDPIFEQVLRYNADEPTGTYYTLVFDTPIPLLADTTYAFDFGLDRSQNGWRDGIPNVRHSGDTYAAGQRYTGARPNQFPSYNVNGKSGDMIFHADIQPTAQNNAIIPEPASLAMGLVGLAALATRRTRRG